MSADAYTDISRWEDEGGAIVAEPEHRFRFLAMCEVEADTADIAAMILAEAMRGYVQAVERVA